MLGPRWVQVLPWPWCQVLFGLAYMSAQKGDTVLAARYVRQAGRFSRYRGKAVRRFAKYLMQDFEADPNGEEARDHAGFDALLEQIDKKELAVLRGHYQGILSFSLIRRDEPRWSL